MPQAARKQLGGIAPAVVMLLVTVAAAARGQVVSADPNLGLMTVTGAFGQVSAIAVQPDGKIVIGGTFTMVNGVRRNNIARLNADGTLDMSWNPNADLDVTALVVTASTVYAAGSFGNIGGQARRHIAALDATTGNATAFNPNPDRFVSAIALSGSTVYAGGTFTNIGGQARNCIAALDAATGLATAWNPNAFGGVAPCGGVGALAVAGGIVYAGGGFHNIGGQARFHLAALDAATGNATAWNPNPSGAPPSAPNIHVLLVSGSTVYAAGPFTNIGGQARNHLAALDAATGNATTWNPNPTGAGSLPNVESLAVSGSTIYAGGRFTNIGGQARNLVAALDASTGNATAWNPNANVDVRALAVSGATVFVGGRFTTIAGETSLTIAGLDAATALHVLAFRPAAGHSGAVSILAEQSDGKIVAAGDFFLWAGKAGVARRRLLRLNADGTLDPGWNPGANNTVRALAVSGTTVFAGGNFTNIGGQTRNRIAALDGATGNATSWDPNSDQPVTALAILGPTLYVGGGFTTIGGQPRSGLAALDVTTGDATTWNPDANGGASVMLISGNTVYLGGFFSAINGQVRIGLAALDATTADLTPWNPTTNGAVNALAFSGNTVFAAGAFTTIGGQPRNHIAALDATTGAVSAWDPDANGSVGALAVSGSTVYAGGEFTSIGGQARSRIAALDAAIGSATAWNPNATGGNFVTGTNVSALVLSAGSVYAGGAFADIVGQPRDGLAALSASMGSGLPVGLTPAVLSLGEQAAGTTGAAQIITLGNSSAASITIVSIMASGDFAQTNTCGTTLPPLESCDISVTFTPTVGGVHAGAITVTSSAAGSPHTASLSGNGTNAGGNFCCEFSPEGCSQTVSHTTSSSSFTFNQRFDLPNIQVNAFLTRLRARLVGMPPVFDQSFATPFSDPTVQSAITTASDALESAAAPQPVTISGPNLLDSSTSTETAPPVFFGDFVDAEFQTISRSVTFGPAVILILTDQAQTCFLPAGDVNVNVHTHAATFNTQVFQATTTTLLSELYELVGITPGSMPAPTLSQWALIALALMLAVAGMRRIGRSRR